LYALIRHFEFRTPHALSTTEELAQFAASSDSNIPFTDEERDMYAFLRADPNRARAMFNMMSASLDWSAESFPGAALLIFRSPIPLRTSTTPVLPIGTPTDPALCLPLPGMVPHQHVLTLNRTTIASLVLGDFDDLFVNREIDVAVANAYNRNFVAQFGCFENVRHLITDRNDELIADMTWAPYDLVKETKRKIIFRRRTTQS
jgi:hypothetical protein